MKRFFYTAVVAGLLLSCEPAKNYSGPEPHLELGQKVIFVGGNLDNDYVIVGYKENFDGRIEKHWRDQDYIVFVYTNAQNDIKEGTVHVNSVIKR